MGQERRRAVGGLDTITWGELLSGCAIIAINAPRRRNHVQRSHRQARYVPGFGEGLV